MKGRIRKKRKKQAYVGALERGNEYLKGAMLRQEKAFNLQIRTVVAENDMLEMLLYAAVIQAGGSVAIETKGLKDMLDGKAIDLRADLESHTVHIEVKDKVLAKEVLDDGKSD